jgi:phage FluMu gp28-like protein
MPGAQDWDRSDPDDPLNWKRDGIEKKGGIYIFSKSSPLSLLLSYQADWVMDGSRFKIGLMARQVGKDYSAAAEGIRDISIAEHLGNGKKPWMITAPSERQSLLSLDKWKEWTEAFQVPIADITEEREGSSESLMKATTIVFPKGSKVVAVPGKPDTVRGDSCNILATEFAFFEDPDATWKAIFATITNKLRGGEKKIRLISTPNGRGNKFSDIWFGTDEKSAKLWSRHKITIYDAVARGLPVDIEELKAAMGDPDAWAQEFECEFLDSAAILLPYDVIAGCENPLATMAVPMEYYLGSASYAAPIFLGIDFGRKRDLSVLTTLERVSPQFHMVREVVEISRMNTVDQMDIFRHRVRKAARVCVDYTGPGIGLGDMLIKEFGEYDPKKHQFGKVELCTMSNELVCDIYTKLRNAFDRHALGVPVNRAFREDLHSVYRTSTPGGRVTYCAPHLAGSHADRCSGLALANRASDDVGGPFVFQLCGKRFNRRESGIYVAEESGPPRHAERGFVSKARERAIG